MLLAFGAAGLWWPAGLQATQEQYAIGVAARRPYLDFLVISPAAFALALGPAASPGWRGCASGRCGCCPGAPSALLLATAALRAPPGWLAAQLALTIALQVGVRSPW